MRNQRKIKTRLNQQWQSWISRRLPAKERITLSHKSIFILPTGFGLTWLALLIILFLFGTNYQNNLVMGLSFLLLSVFNTCIIYSYKNLAGLTLSGTQANNPVAGQPIYFPVNLTSPNSAYEVQLNFENQPIEVINKVDPHQTQALIGYNNAHRGINHPGRIKIETRYPLGLFRAWSHIDLALTQLVYAKPIVDPKPLCLSAQQSADQQATGKYVAGIDEYKGLKEYARGESLKQVAWKQWAQGRGLLTKEFEEPQGAPMWLSLEDEIQDLELALSHLAWHTEQLSSKGQVFGLKIGAVSIPPSHGEHHRKQVQTQLALFPNPNTSPKAAL
ncbi:DUF58 domain-containing protein [Shewanella sp. Isolate13]|uniref:DUF58 domain-containing protein n=1 Tax=Shewanella sp. Isolate13 TaxID=2908531 RepID=UPI001EFDA4D5|nr:DUF58 domain-containing protein [Shewanella sp. Isolate13]MCG9731779.1 DUF58 domain-containing protein [Shewanella sp. Isolate13]